MCLLSPIRPQAPLNGRNNHVLNLSLYYLLDYEQFQLIQHIKPSAKGFNLEKERKENRILSF